ncbi:DUF4350 domain-containing protein [Leifsonia sp. AG29]|uniref:DUF4350 domain-containing protein n=1 Tax=Leifsonia sp. AG29 TaxID=2598860 RepID=UPI00131E4BEA|nr:DUF4350 domain-containing protein [Leifsonia sp. AG29]
MSAPAPTRAEEREGGGTASQDAQALTPSVRQTARRAVPWIILGAIAVLVTLFGILLTGGGSSAGVPLDRDNAGPVGGRAVAQVLEQQGVNVRTANSLSSATRQAEGDTTILVFDPQGDLDADAYHRLASSARTLVVVEPDFSALQTLAPRVSAGGAPTGTALAGCDLPVAVRAGRIDPRPSSGTASGTSHPGTFRVTGDGTACFRSGDRASLVATEFSGSRLYLVGSAAVLMNDGAARLGNAALSLGVLGEHRTLVWYLPSIDDRPVTGPPSLQALTPGWVTPVVILFVLVAIAAAVWRGRRFGPLVVEDLPVIVRAGETVEGRARLYQRSRARLRAADALRIGALGRLARLAGLPAASTAPEIADAAAALTGRDPSAVRALLIDAVPSTDAALLTLSDDLAALEGAVAAAVSPADPRPTGRMDP